MWCQYFEAGVVDNPSRHQVRFLCGTADSARGREGDWFHIGVASNKSYISLYVAAGGVADRYKEALPEANIGKGCVRFKRLSDLDTAALKKLIRESATAEA